MTPDQSLQIVGYVYAIVINVAMLILAYKIYNKKNNE
jgi:hypothetical protein